MGDIIEINGKEIIKLNGTSESMKNASEKAIGQFNEMNNVIHDAFMASASIYTSLLFSCIPLIMDFNCLHRLSMLLPLLCTFLPAW